MRAMGCTYSQVHETMAAKVAECITGVLAPMLPSCMWNGGHFGGTNCWQSQGRIHSPSLIRATGAEFALMLRCRVRSSCWMSRGSSGWQRLRIRGALQSSSTMPSARFPLALSKILNDSGGHWRNDVLNCSTRSCTIPHTRRSAKAEPCRFGLSRYPQRSD